MDPTGDNAPFLWDESADVNPVGTTTATGDATGNVHLQPGFTAGPGTFSDPAIGGGFGSTGVTISSAGVIPSRRCFDCKR